MRCPVVVRVPRHLRSGPSSAGRWHRSELFWCGDRRDFEFCPVDDDLREEVINFNTMTSNRYSHYQCHLWASPEQN